MRDALLVLRKTALIKKEKAKSKKKKELYDKVINKAEYKLEKWCNLRPHEFDFYSFVLDAKVTEDRMVSFLKN
jgi:hypothetical protein